MIITNVSTLWTATSRLGSQKLILLIDSREHRPVDRRITHSSLEREIGGSNLGPVKSDTMLWTVCHRCDISSNEAVLPACNEAEMASPNWYTFRRNAASITKDLIWFSWAKIKCSILSRFILVYSSQRWVLVLTLRKEQRSHLLWRLLVPH